MNTIKHGKPEESPRPGEDRLAAELDAMTRLHDLSTRLLTATDLRTALDDVLEGAIVASGADFGNVQLLNPDTAALEIVAQRGFRQDFLDYFRTVRVDEGSACAQAMQRGERVIIEDVELDPTYEPHRRVAAAAGYRGVQSTPLTSRGGGVLGMLSTHFRRPHRPSERDQRLLDLYARHAADLVERLRADEQLRAAREQLQIVTDAMSAPVTRCSRDLRYLWVSRPYADWVGRPAEEVVGRPIREVIGEDAFRQLLPHFEKVLAGQRVRYEQQVNFRGPGLRWVSAVYAPTVDAAGATDGWVAVVLDVTERKELEEALRRADRRKDEFLATLAHELRNPLAPLRNGLELLRCAGDNRPMVERARGLMERQVAQLVRLVDDLLDLSRITRGKLQLRTERVALADVLSAAVETARPSLDGSAHELTVRLPPEPVELRGDATRLAQVFANLLTNAAKYTDRGGRIRLSAERRDGEVVVSVRDSGIGIAAEHLPRLFEMFSQAAPALERSQGGLGIGLALVKGLVQMHGGTVEAHSDGLGHGSEFVVRLPLVVDGGRWAVDGGEDPSSPPTPHHPPPTRRIVVADDSRDAADSLTLLLRLAGHEVHTTYDGQQAVEAAGRLRPDVILLDIGMPRLNGYEACRRIRQQPWGKAPLLVAITGWGQEDDRRQAAEAGFDRHLTKPVDPIALEKLLSEWRRA